MSCAFFNTTERTSPETRISYVQDTIIRSLYSTIIQHTIPVVTSLTCELFKYLATPEDENSVFSKSCVIYFI